MSFEVVFNNNPGFPPHLKPKLICEVYEPLSKQYRKRGFLFLKSTILLSLCMKAEIRIPENFKLYSTKGPLYSNFNNELNMEIANEILNKPLSAVFWFVA